MIVKNAAGENHDIIFHHFFPTNRKRIAKLLSFISDNLDKRDKYYGIMMKYLTSRYIAADYEIEVLKAERQAKNRALHEAHVQQANLRKRAKWMSASTFRDKNRALEETIMLIERRKLEITLELSATKHLKDRLKINTQLMVEVKPW